jgi:L,D-transpeptidase catalytic domain
MKPIVKFIFSLLLLCCLIILSSYYLWYKPKFNTPVDIRVPSAKMNILKSKAETLFNYSSANGYNTRTCFLIDMDGEPGANRFFVFDMKQDTLIAAGLVTHGNCNENWLTGRRYSNEKGSGCTSLGKYKIGGAYYGKFGLAYKLYGLDSSNSNAYNRFVVLHSHSCVPDEEVNPVPICQSLGCPTVSPLFLKKLKKIIDGVDKPILLWIYGKS